MGTRRDQPRRNPPANVHTSPAIPAWCTGEIPLEQVHTEFSKMSGPKIELLAKNGKWGNGVLELRRPRFVK
jgi:hypothetical protein